MAKYKIPQKELDEALKNRVLSVVRHYTFKEGGLDPEKVNPKTLEVRHAITKEDLIRLLPDLVTEGKVKEIKK